MSPLRWDVLLVGFLLSLPVLALGLRGDLSTEEMMTRVLWCLGAGWAAVAVLRIATAPRTVDGAKHQPEPASADSEPAATS